MTLPVTIDLYEYDGILALVDTAAYRSEIAWVSLEEDLVPHLAREAEAGHLIVWRTSELGGGEFRVDVVPEPTDAQSHRELTASIDVTEGRLHLVNYTDLTMASDEEQGALPFASGADWSVELENGRYEVTVRQFFDPAIDLQADDGASFEIVLRPSVSTAESAGVVGIHWWQ